MKPLTKLISFFAACIFTLSGCTSLRERAETMLKDGRVDEALTLIETGRTEDQNDPEIAALERRIRHKWISDKLIQVRLARLAESKGESIELMRKILINESKWQMIPTGAVFATQAEESTYLSEFVQTSIYDALKRKQPLEAMDLYRRDKVLLEDLLKIETARLKSAIAVTGIEFCNSEATRLTESDFYSAKFLKTSCDEFGNKFKPIRTKNSVTLFRGLNPKIELTNLPLERAADFSRDLKTEFEKSIWFDPSAAASLAMTLTGPVTEAIETQKVYRSKPYTVRVPYEEAIVRKKTDHSESTGIGTLFAILAWALTSYQPSREVDNRDGTVTVYETKYRDETRHFAYEATEVTQTISVKWKISLSPQAQSHSFEFEDQIKTISDEHDVRFESANLEPQTRRIVRPADWLIHLNQKLMDRIGREFNTAWIDRFCKNTLESTATGPKPEIYHRCIYGANGHAPTFVNEWFTKRYGIEIETWRRLVAVHKDIKSI